MASYYKSKGITMLQARENLYNKYGVYHHSQESFQFEGISGMQKMADIMKSLRENVPTEIGGLKVTTFEDYTTSQSKDTATGEVTPISLPKSDVLVFKLTNGASVVIRPSGTEPKIKAYYTTIANTKDEALALKETISNSFKKILGV
jgi:phosphoglucomutase